MQSNSRAIIYTRVSTEDQAENGTSLASQKEACEQKAKALGAVIVEHVEDAGVSGAKFASRPGLQRALGAITMGEADVLVVYDMSRLSRDTEHSARIRKTVQAAGARVAYCTIDFGESAEDELAEDMMSVLPAYERKKIRERTMNGKRRIAKESGRTSARGRHPFGYRIVTKTDVIRGLYEPGLEGTYQMVEDRALWVLQMYERYDQGASLRQLSRWLHECGVQTQNGGNLWHSNTIRDILLNPVNKGKPVFGRREHRADESRLQNGYKTERFYRAAPKDQWIELEAPAIVDEELWQRVVDRIGTNRQTKSGTRKHRHMLTGMVRCRKCGVLMVSKSRREYSYYLCRYYGLSCSPKGHICDKKNYRVSDYNERVKRGIREVVARPELIKDALAAYRRYQAADDVQIALEKTRKEVENLRAEENAAVRAQIEGIKAGVHPQIYANILSEVASKRTAAEERLKSLEATHKRESAPKLADADAIQAALTAVDMVLDSPLITDAERNDLLSRVVRAVYLEEDRVDMEVEPFGGGTDSLITINCTVLSDRVEVNVIRKPLEMAA